MHRERNNKMELSEITKHKINVILAYIIGYAIIIILMFVMNVVIITAYRMTI